MRILRFLQLVVVFLYSFLSSAQNGPGGIGDGTGTNGPRNVLWLDASSLGLSNGANVTTWTDLSGNSNDLTQQGADPVPTFAVDAFGTGLDAVRFDGTERYLRIVDNASLDGFTGGVSIITVVNFSTVDDSPRGIISKRTSSSSEEAYSIFTWTGSVLNFDVRTTDDNRLGDATTLSASTNYILSSIYDRTLQYISIDGSAPSTRSETGAVNDATSDLIIGALNNNYGTYFDGDIAEVIIYGDGLTQAERVVIENYLADKYSITISNDFWSNSATYSNDIAGIGQESTYNSEAQSASSGFMRISESTDFDDNDWIFWGHDNGDVTTWSGTEVPGSQQRLAREWLIEENGDAGSVRVTIAESDLPSTGISNAQYYLLVDTDNDADFSDATPFLMVSDGAGNVYANVDLNTNDRIAISFEAGSASQIWYSYLSGNWNDPNNWTLDGAISPLYLNPSSQVPGASDSVVINTGRTITMDVNDVTVTRLEIIGTLDLAATTGHTFGVLDGSGTLRLSGASGVENYPVTSDALFIDPDEGGTLEIYGTGLSMNADRNANNMLINLTNSTDVVTNLTDINLNGNLTIRNGIFQFNDNSSTEGRNVTVDGNVLVESTGGIDVGTANARHEFNLNGNFTNQGDVDFTNRTSQTTGSEATDGIVDVNFISANSDQIVDLQNTTDFYRIEINKGVDDTYVVDISADDPSYFNLYGYANESTNSSQLTANSNALGLIYGTVKVGNNVTISPLNAGGNYSVFEGSQIWVDGGTVEKTGGTAIVPYGSIRVSSGVLNAPINSGITTRDNGQLTIEGGTVTINQFRTSINGPSAEGGLIMTGGIFNVTGGTTSTNYYTFSLTYEGNVFVMSGGVLNLSGVNTTGGIYINSATENISVSGGTVNLDVTNGNDLTITSSAPFFNLNVLRSSGAGSGTARVTSGSSGTGGGQTTYTPTELKVLNDFTIDNSAGNGTEFDANGIDVRVTGSLIVETGSVVDFAGSNVIFEGAGSSSIDVGLASTLVLDSLEINKNNEFVNVNITNGQATALQIDEYLNVVSGNFNLNSFDIDANGNLSISDTVGTATSTGLVRLNGSAAQAVTSSSGAIYDLEIDNANGVSLSGNFGVIDQLDLNNGVFDINTSKLTTGAQVATTGTFGTSLMIQTNGNASDGGLEYYFDGMTADPANILYPIGTDANAITRYTPATLDLSSVSDDGYVGISLADAILQTTDLTGGNILSYYWRSNNDSFTTAPTAVYTFTYAASDDDAGDEGNYVPGKVLDETPFTRSSEQQSNVNTGTNVITFDNDGGGGFTLENANYTAGLAARFVGAPTVYYSRRHQIGGGGLTWNDLNDWSTDPVLMHGGAAAASVPGNGDVVVIGAGQINGSDEANDTGLTSTTARHQMVAQASRTVAEVIFNSNPAGTAIGNNLSRIRLSNTGWTLTAGKISGLGELMLAISTSAEATIVADFGDFNEVENSTFFLDLTTAGTATFNSITEFPGIRIYGRNIAGKTLRFGNDITGRQILLDGAADLEVASNMTIEGNVQLGNNRAGSVTFPDIGTNYTFSIGGDLITNEPNTSTNNQISVASTGTDIHTLRVGGNIDLQFGDVFDLADASNVILELFGEGQHTFTNTSAASPDLYRVVMNKGADTTNTFSINDQVTINGDNTVVPPAVELQNGKLIINDASISSVIADGIDYSIPSSAGLEVMQGNISTTGSNVILDGLLRVNGGTVSLGTSDIEYSNTGTALIDVSSGTLNIGGQVRRSTSSTTGILKYRQSGGDVDIATDGASTAERGAFEVLNAGSEFTLTGGTFNVERGVTGNDNVSLRIAPTTYNVSGSTINIFENLGADYGATYFNISSTIALNNLVIANSIDLPDVRLYNQNLEVNDLTINTNQSLLANGFDMTINGNYANSGTYTNTSSETIFAGSGAQSITGSGTNTIYDLRKSGAGTTNSSVSLDLANDFYLTAGTFDIGANSLSLQNDAYIQSTFANTGGNGLVFNGTANQDLNGFSNNTISIGTITISNPSGVDIPDGNGFNFDITQELRLNGGVFNIGGSLVTLTAGSPVTPVSPFNVNNMVQTNSSFTDNGLKIDFFGVAADTTVFFPVGELKYTPVQFELDAGSSAGSVRVRPANERHPTIINDAEPGTVADPEIDDTQNVLQYHWIVVAESITSADGTATFFYDHADITNIETDTANFISARLLANGINWDKFAPTLFLGASQSFQVPLSSFTAAEITGDYTAGAGSSDGINADIEGAIPDQLAQYETTFTGTGNYSEAINWNTINGPDVTDGVGPVGAQIIVRSGDDLTLNLDNIRLYATEIEAGAILRVPAGTTGVRLGTVTGSGTIVLEDNELLPTGEYSSFFQCNGGALQYSGTTSYSVLTGISQVRKVIFEGTGTRTLPNNLITVCDTLEINGPTVLMNSGLTYTIGDADTDLFDIQAGSVTLSNGSVINLTGDFEMSGGSFTGAANTDFNITDDVTLTSGTLNWNDTDVTLNGSTEQLMDGAFTGSAGFDDLTINNSGAGITINSGDVEVGGILTLTDGLVNTSSSETLTLTSSGNWTGASSSSYITGPLAKEDIAATSTFEFPIGKSARYAPASIVNVGTGGDDWTAEYFTSTNPTYNNATFDTSDPGSGFNALISVQNSDRWEITSAGSNTAQVRATYGSHNNFGNTASIRLVWWDDEAVLDGDAAENRWENQGGQVSGTTSSGTVTSENTIFFSTRQVGLGYAPESVLPVELLDFTAVAKDNKVKLSWSTVSELNNDFFEILHSTDGITFASIGLIEGNGTTNELIEYSLTHDDPVLGDNYYQLKQVDYDGAQTLYEIVKVYNDYHRASMEITVYPNPATVDNLRLRISSGDSHTPINVRLIDQTGKTHYQRTLNSSLDFDEKVDPDLNMVPGIYYMIVTQGDQIQRQKIIIK